jgi:CRP/FNR family transcriptional regulator
LARSFRQERLFCNLSSPALEFLSSITKSGTYPKGAALFVEGQEPRGVFILCSGRAKLSSSSPAGKTLIFRIAQPGEVLGLSATISGKPYQVTAELFEPSQVSFISQEPFLRFMREHGEVACKVAEELSRTSDAAFAEALSLGLGARASEKLARLLLDLSENQHKGKSEVRIKLTLTYEERGQMIGILRETVTRLLATFRKRQLVQIKGSTLIVRRAALENLFRT